MALKSSKELIRATSDNSMAQRRFKEQEDDVIYSGDRRVPVVYYLCRNGQLDHPHFMEVTLSSPNGLYLRDVINRLNNLRGKAMASLYSWSSKRTYKNGFVWQDLSLNDFISPVNGHEYILKGSQILETTSSDNTNNTNSITESTKFPAITRRRNQSWSSIDLTEYKVYKSSESSTESTHKLAAANASTQTDDRRRRRKPVIEEESSVNQITELRRDEISPPESDSSPETLETLMKADGRLILRSDDEQETNRTVQSLSSSGKMRASAVLMQLISCGAMSFKKCGPTLMSGRTVERGVGDCRLERAEKELKSFGGVKLEEKEYFSGSLIETKKEGVADLKRSSSYNADRSSKMGLVRDKNGEELVVSRKDINNKR